MATLQNIRSKGPLLVIAVGLALFAFIAGDAWRVLQPHQSQDVGEVNGDVLSAQDYQSMVDEYAEVVKFTSGTNALSDDQLNQLRDEVWRTYVNNQLIEAEAEKLGLTVSKEEIKSIINEGTHPLLAQTPFRNPQTGAFDKDMLMKFLADYAKMNQGQMPAQYADYYNSLYKVWSFIEKTLVQTRLQEKYSNLIAKSLLSNPVEAQMTFDGRIDQKDMLLAAVPYSSIVDSTITVTDAELKAAYDEKKEQYRQYVETRNIKYIDVQVTASDEDKVELRKEMDEYTAQLAGATSDYSTLVRSTGSEQPYVDLYYTTRALPSDVVARLDSVAMGDVYGPYYNALDNTMNSFKKLAKASMPDSIQYRQIQVVAETPEKTKTLADSIYNAIKGGADFAEVAKKYGQTGESIWITSANYEGAQVDGDNLKYITAVTTGETNDLQNLSLAQGNVILQVTGKKAYKDKYKVAVVKRAVEFSKDTYSKAYNDFSQFIAANNTLDKLVANAEDAGYRLLDRTDLYSAEHSIGGVRGTKEALRWVFSAKPGEVSGLYECGESDHMMVVGLVSVAPEGYRSLAAVQNDLRMQLVRDKKAEKIMADMKAANASTFDQYKGLANAVTDSVKHVTFDAPAFVSVLRSSEPLVSAYASVGAMNQLSAPIKGNAGVFVLQPYAEEKLNETYDEKAEVDKLQGMYTNLVVRQFVNDLYLKANVKDDRYLFF
ncbi:SurA N-terminal domain-containing protein [Mediterranea massiliensis]|uniref:SurA N-terminal domain-containing protein n=1 Tax=Mediterranea massiliensis TaxID=1841865 RepID=A0ABS2E0T7_9BACT|nr:peptidylprolyl isomerase [Mediterranea massiliensis]MBM6735226.1 SurA N-terminal domain-containing protein [Mediterranea massiliensis]